MHSFAPNNDPRRHLIVALDVGGELPALKLVERLAGTVSFFKIGLELFTLAGPSIVSKIRQVATERVDEWSNTQNVGIFLDLKFHDIPNTVERAVRSATELGVDMLTVHLSGGSAMLHAAVKGLEGSSIHTPTLPSTSLEAASTRKPPILLGVTVLTSHTPQTLKEVGVQDDAATQEEQARNPNHLIQTQVLRLAQLGLNCGLGGLVASPHELAALREAFGQQLRIVTPGVRPAWAKAKDEDDQRRVMTPAEALKAGADYLVIGRPITAHPNPKSAAEMILEEIATAQAQMAAKP